MATTTLTLILTLTLTLTPTPTPTLTPTLALTLALALALTLTRCVGGGTFTLFDLFMSRCRLFSCCIHTQLLSLCSASVTYTQHCGYFQLLRRTWHCGNTQLRRLF